MSTREIPEPWRGAMIAAGVVDPRRPDAASMTQLGLRLDVTTTTVSHMVFGTRKTDGRTVQRAAEVLGVDARIVEGWVGRARVERAPYHAPADANLLDKDQRKIIDGLIRHMVRYIPVDAIPEVSKAVEPVDSVEHTDGPARR